MRVGINELKKIIKEELKRVLREDDAIEAGVRKVDDNITSQVNKGVELCRAQQRVLDTKRAASGYEAIVMKMMKAHYVDNDKNEAARQFKGGVEATGKDQAARKAFLDLVEIYGTGVESAKRGSCISNFNWVQDKGYGKFISGTLKEGVFQDAKQWYEMMFKRSSQCGFLPQLKQAQQNASGYDKNVKNVMDLYYRVRDEQAAKKALIDTLIPATNNRKDYASLIDLINQYGRDLENTVHADYCGGVSQRGWIVDSFGMTGLELLRSAGVDVKGITKPQ